MSKNIVLSSKRLVAFTPQAAGSSTLTSGVIDMDGHVSAVIETLIGSLTAGQTKGTIQINGGNASNGSDQAALAGALITINDADTGKLEVIEVYKPPAIRYIEIVITRNTQACAVSSCVVTLHGTRKAPDSDDPATVAQTLLAVDPVYANSALTVANTVYPGSTTQIVNTMRTSG